MNEKRPQQKHIKRASLNEPVRKRVVDYINQENTLMMKRLDHVPPVINNVKLAHDFKEHLKAEKNLRRRQMKPLALPKDLHPTSPLRNRSADTDRLFDSSMYTTQRNQFMHGSSLESLSLQPSGIKSVVDFRREVIATKRLKALSPQTMQNSLHLGESRMSVESVHFPGMNAAENKVQQQMQAQRDAKKPTGGAVYEMSYHPAEKGI